MDKLRNLFESYTGQKVSDTEELNSSGSNRRYFRIKGGDISIIRLRCRAMETLPKLQCKGAEGLDWSVCYPEPAFNERMILFDLNYFKYCFLKATGLEFNEVKLQDDFERLKTDLMQDMGDT